MSSTLESGSFELSGTFVGHKKLVTKIAVSAEKPDVIVSSSRDRTLLSWRITREPYGVNATLMKEYKGHNHFVSDVTLSSDGMYAISCSWDKSLCLWDVETAKQSKRFVGHSEEIYALSMSADNRQIVSASADCTVMLWNTIGQCKYVFKNEGHKSTVSSVCLSPSIGMPLMVSGGYDRVVKAWKMNQPSLVGNLNTKSDVICTCFSPNSMFIAAGTSRGFLYLWFLKQFQPITEQCFTKPITAVAFKPDSNVLAVASGNSIYLLSINGIISKLESTKMMQTCKVIQTLFFEVASSENDGKLVSPDCTALTWSPDGEMLYGGYSDSCIRVWLWKKMGGDAGDFNGQDDSWMDSRD